MKYTVRNQDGELTFGSIHELRAMFQQGLVEAEDEVRPEDSNVWRKAAAIPELREYAAAKRAQDTTWFRFGLISALCLSAAFYALVVRHSWWLTLICMVPVLGMSQRAFTKFARRERR